jgi:phage terminase large subunit GpA-like protein
MSDYLSVFKDILNGARVQISNIKPSDWVEQNRYMTPDVSPIPGMFSYDNSPYAREIIDCLSPENPARRIAIMKGAQIGLSTGVIEGGIGWIISQNPGNILFLVGHEDLVKDAGNKVDRMIDNTGIRHLIKSTSLRARNTKSGDTDGLKEFPSGYLKMGIANHKSLRNISMQYGFIDDYESMKGDTKQSGSTQEMVEARFTAYAKKMKLFFISTPELEESSNIEPVYLLGDQRKYHIPCPCCNEYILLEWSIQNELNESQTAGITWLVDDNNELIEDSVGYTCYKCGNFFDDRDKNKIIRAGKWIPTAKPSQPGFVSFHISSLYAPTYMFSWSDYVRKYLEANPIGGQRNESKHKTFLNVVLGKTYKQVAQTIKASTLQENIRSYDIGVIPEKLSIADGNGKIVLITLGSDMNGTEDDARLDYEVVAFSESGATYSIEHGSIGTFIPKDSGRIDREKLTYKHGSNKSVWPILKQITEKKYVTDTGREMKIFISGLDCGYLPNHAYQFLDTTNNYIVGLKGKGENKYQNIEVDLKTFRRSRERPNNLFLVETNHTKDILANYMSLQWNPDWQENQPANFMNFPTPSGGYYLLKNYFSHFEAEEKRIDKSGNFIWEKKSSAHQNHLFDCRLYAYVVRDILLERIFSELKIKNGTWTDYVNIIMKKK